MSNLTVTKSACRHGTNCYKCWQPEGQQHLPTCDYVVKKVTVKLTVTYELEVPARMTASEIERNNAIAIGHSRVDYTFDRIVSMRAQDGCECKLDEYECINADGEQYLREP